MLMVLLCLYLVLFVWFCRIWFVCGTEDSKSMQMNAMQLVIGYMNVIPKCLNSDGKYPLYANLPETYAAINSYLINSPLEGNYFDLIYIISIFWWHVFILIFQHFNPFATGDANMRQLFHCLQWYTGTERVNLIIYQTDWLGLWLKMSSSCSCFTLNHGLDRWLLPNRQTTL